MDLYLQKIEKYYYNRLAITLGDHDYRSSTRRFKAVTDKDGHLLYVMSERFYPQNMWVNHIGHLQKLEVKRYLDEHLSSKTMIALVMLRG